MKNKILYIWGEIVDFVLAKKENVSAFQVPRPRYITKITFFDKINAATALKLFPIDVKPNHLTVFRFLMTPVVLIVLLLDYKVLGLVLFIITAYSDSLDGSMARTRNKITDWGIVFDPFADKLLIGSVGFLVITQYLNFYIALTIVFLELALIISSYLRFKGRVIPAKTTGKIKMFLQCLGIIFILFYMVIGDPWLLPAATYTLYLSILFSILSLTVYRSV
ncbi:MAG: CDP-alcohol phosphatidyltransferase family protein [Minisyncoccia bacterium]